MNLPKGTKEMPLAAVKEKGRIDKLRATEADVRGKPGYERYHLVQQDNGSFSEVKSPAPDGSYKWRYRFEQNDGHGKVTKQGMEVRELLAPWMEADAARFATQYGQPGDYGIRSGPGQVTFLGRLDESRFCPECECLWTWCECNQNGSPPKRRRSRMGAGKDASGGVR